MGDEGQEQPQTHHTRGAHRQPCIHATRPIQPPHAHRPIAKHSIYTSAPSDPAAVRTTLRSHSPQTHPEEVKPDVLSVVVGDSLRMAGLAGVNLAGAPTFRPWRTVLVNTAPARSLLVKEREAVARTRIVCQVVALWWGGEGVCVWRIWREER